MISAYLILCKAPSSQNLSGASRDYPIQNYSGSPFCPSLWQCISSGWEGEDRFQKEKTCAWSHWEVVHTDKRARLCTDHHTHWSWTDPWDASIWILEGDRVQALQLCCPGYHTPRWSLAPLTKGMIKNHMKCRYCPSQVRAEYRQIFLEMGFTEMPTNNFVESSFWNFDALFQPQQHPAR